MAHFVLPITRQGRADTSRYDTTPQPLQRADESGAADPSKNWLNVRLFCAEETCMPDGAPDSAEHIAYYDLERYALNANAADEDRARIQAHLGCCPNCRESYEEEKVYLNVMRAAFGR